MIAKISITPFSLPAAVEKAVEVGSDLRLWTAIEVLPQPTSAGMIAAGSPRIEPRSASQRRSVSQFLLA